MAKIRLYLPSTIDIEADHWMSEDAWWDSFADKDEHIVDIVSLIDLFAEDMYTLIEDMGQLNELILDAEWIDD